MDLAVSFKQTLSPLWTLTLDLSGWRGPPCQEAFYAGGSWWLMSGRAVPGGSQGRPPLTGFSQAGASLCQVGKPTKALW